MGMGKDGYGKDGYGLGEHDDGGAERRPVPEGLYVGLVHAHATV